MRCFSIGSTSTVIGHPLTFFRTLAGLFAKQSQLKSPRELYSAAFSKAVHRTRSLGLEIDIPPTNSQSFMTDVEQLRTAGHVIRRYLADNGREVSDLAVQCWRANMEIKPLLEEFFETTLTLTFGAIETSPGTVRFAIGEKELRNLVRNGLNLSTPAVNLHAWLTFPSMEIIDITYLTSYGVVNDKPDLLGMVVTGMPGALNPVDYTYHPLVLGEHFVAKAGLNRVRITWA